MQSKYKIKMPHPLEDRIKSQLNHEFYEKNKSLFKQNLQEYFRQCDKYCQDNYEQRLEELQAEGNEIKKLKSPKF